MLTLSHYETRDTASKIWALVALFQMNKWMCSHAALQLSCEQVQACDHPPHLTVPGLLWIEALTMHNLPGSGIHRSCFSEKRRPGL